MRGILFFFGSILLFAGSCNGPGNAAEKPNIIFILVDDLGWADPGCYGSSFHETPNIDRLAGESMRFTQAYAACPVCSPTRASILTGKYPARTGITDWIPGRQAHAGPQSCDRLVSRDFNLQMDLSEVTVAEALGKAGYRTFFAGKWHLGAESVYWPENQGFDINIGGWGTGWPQGGYFSPYENPRLENGPPGEHLTDRLTDESIHFMETHLDTEAGTPFFLFLSFYAVHTPLQAKPGLIRKYEQKKEQTGVDSLVMETTGKEWIQHAPPGGRYVERIRQGHPVYAGMIETLDANVGRLINALEEFGLKENTVVFFMSDNGGLSTAEGSPTSNLPLRAGKGWLYEGGIRVPMLIRWPGSGSAGKVSDVPLTSTDFYPTILEMAGLEPIPGQHTDGISMVPLLTGQAESGLRPLFWHYPHYSNQGGKPGSAVRLGDYKLIEFFEDSTVELYNLSADPGEENNLSAIKPEKAKELLEILHRWQHEVGAEGMDPNPGFDPDYSREDFPGFENVQTSL